MCKFFAIFFLFITSLSAPIVSLENEKTAASHQIKEAKKDKDKKKDKVPPAAEPPSEKSSFSEAFQKIVEFSFAKCAQAEAAEAAIIRTFTNATDVSLALNAVADLYDSAFRSIKENLKITSFFKEKEILEQQIYTFAFAFESQAKRCRQEAIEWPRKILKKHQIAAEELERLRNESSFFKEQEARYEFHEAYKQMTAILSTLVENGAPHHDELVSCQKKLIELEASKDLLHLTDQPAPISLETFYEDELFYRNYFFYAKKTDDSAPYAAIALDGQGTTLYLTQFYRYLIQREEPAEHLRVKVFENGNEIYEEYISLPNEGPLWDHFLVFDKMLLTPQTPLNSLFGLNLRITCLLDPYYRFSLVISQKGLDPKYQFSFFLDDQALYDIRFIPQPPWQLEALRKPQLSTITHALPKTPVCPAFPLDNVSLNPIEEIPQPHLDLFIKEMNGDPLALSRYVHNEIEMADPFLVRNSENVFQAPSIHRSPQRTFLEKKGSPWEQCTLLVYLLKHAGYKTQYIEGISSLPSSFAERLLFIQFPEEEEILVNYPGVMFFDGQEWHSLFPWMKEICMLEGHDLYSLMPEEYGNAERWLKCYLCNDEKIHKHIGPDGNDTVGVLFIRHLEECLRNQGLSLQDIGTHRSIQKKQFHTWDDFPQPAIRGKMQASQNLPERNDIFAKIKVTISSEQNPLKKIELQPLNLSAFSLDSFAIYFTPHSPSEHLLHFCSSNNWNAQHGLLLDATDTSVNIDVFYETLMGSKDGYNIKKRFSLIKGTCASLCLHSGGSNEKITSLFAQKFTQAESQQQKLNALFSFIGAAYFEKCSRSEQILAKLHKIAPQTHFCVGLSKLSPDPSSADLRFPQVDMNNFHIIQNHNKHPFSTYQEPHLSYRNYNVLTNADGSSNEHQVLREVYQDPYAISTVKLLQIAHQNHKRKGLPGPGFLMFTSKSFTDADTVPELARLLHFPSFNYANIQQIKTAAADQWDMLRSLFKQNDSRFSYAYMTPGPISSLDGYGLKPPSYTGIGTLIHSSCIYGSLISDGSHIMNGGYGSRLPNNFVQTITHQDWQLASNGNSYSFLPIKYVPLFNGDISYQPSQNEAFSILKTKEGSNHSLAWWNNAIWTMPRADSRKADVRQDHKSLLATVGDPVDVVSGAFYVDELDLNLPGPFPLEVRRNYNSQNPLPGPLGFGWKLSLNPSLYEEGDKLFAAEKDGTIIVYRYDPIPNRWVVLPEDNPELSNCNKQGIGSTANPFHAYIEKKQGYLLYSADGSKRFFQNQLLQTWSDSSGNTLTFSYENKHLKRIESSSGGFLAFDYNYGEKISEIYAKDGRRISYTYDTQGNLATVTLPNTAVIKYDYDRFHRIIRETKPHGRVLENIYKEDKVVEQRSPIGPYQHMVCSAAFSYSDGLTIATDGAGGITEYKIYKKQIYKITDPEGYQTLQSWFLDDHTYFDAETEKIQTWDKPGAYPGSLKSSKDKRALTTSYLYDERGNVQELTLAGLDLTGNGDTSISKCFLYNSHNLCIEEETLNTKTITVYDANNPYLPRRIEKYVRHTLVSFDDLEYTPHGLISKKNHCGSITLFEYDSRDFLTKKIQKTGTEDPDVVSHYIHNDQGQSTDLITADSIQHNAYDIAGNVCCCTLSLLSGKILSKTYFQYDLNNELIGKQGDDPNDTLFLDYNAAGHLKASRKNLSQIKDDSIQWAGVAYSLYEYDACGRLIEQVDPLGNSTHFKHDLLGRVIESAKNRLCTKFSYEPGGLTASITTPGGAATTSLYTTNGLLTKTINADGSELSYLYDFFGRIVQQNKNGITTTISYNDAEYQERRSEGEFTEICTFDARGNLVSFTDRAGYTLTKIYDALDRLKMQISPNGETTLWNYLGDTVICTLSNGESTIQRFEAGNLAESQTFATDGSLLSCTRFNRHPEQSMTEEITGDITKKIWSNTQGLPIRIQQGSRDAIHFYDACGNCITSIDEEGNTTSYAFDPSGRLVKKTLPDGACILYSYDADSRLIASHMPGNLAWKATYDSMDRKIVEWQEFEEKPFQKREYFYEHGRLIAIKAPQNRLYQYEYDEHARLKKESIEKCKREYTYDPRGFLNSATESGKDISKVERDYDESGRLIKEVISLNGTVLQNTSQSWTSSTRSLQIGDHRRDFHYQGGRLSQITAQGLNLYYDYNLNGALIKKKTPFSTLDICYNDSALPENIDIKLIGDSYKESLAWTPSGRLASHHSTYPEMQADTFAYSSRGYLKSSRDASYLFDFDKPGRGVRTSAPHLEAVNQDEYGRIIQERTHTGFLNTLYDDLGQVILHNQDQLTWDPWGRLIVVKNDKYEWTASYDALGRRLQTSYTPINNYYLFKTNGKPVVHTSYYDPEHEFLEIGVAQGKMTFWKFYGQISCDALLDSEGEVIVLHHDARNNLQAIVTQEEVLWNKDYPTPYGPRGPPLIDHPHLLTFAKSLTWQSQQLDPTGLMWLGARYYDPSGGRFLSPDPISHPACLDLYSYANGDPINYSDPSGRWASAVYQTIGSAAINALQPLGVNLAIKSNNYLASFFANNNLSGSSRFQIGSYDLPFGALGFTNGINNNEKRFLASVKQLNEYARGANVYAVFNKTHTSPIDVLECGLGHIGFHTPPVQLLKNKWDCLIAIYGPEAKFFEPCHSGGAIHLKNALLSSSESVRQQIIVLAIAPAVIIPKKLCYQSDNYISRRDFITHLDIAGKIRYGDELNILEPHPEANFWDHEFLSPTFADTIQRHISEYIEKYGNKK